MPASHHSTVDVSATFYIFFNPIWISDLNSISGRSVGHYFEIQSLAYRKHGIIAKNDSGSTNVDTQQKTYPHVKNILTRRYALVIQDK